jgi:hypothetical protein
MEALFRNPAILRFFTIIPKRNKPRLAVGFLWIPPISRKYNKIPDLVRFVCFGIPTPYWVDRDWQNVKEVMKK